MRSRKLIITESEKSQIKKLYGLIKEQDATQANPEITLDLAGTFGSGKYKLPEKATKIDDLITQIRDFKNNNKGSVIEISINSGESQVPNYDREKYPSTGDKTKDFTPEKKLAVGDLGKLRAQSLKSYIEKNAPDLVADAKIVITEPVIGKEKWLGDDPNLEKYTKEQFANFKIKAIGKKDDMSVIPGGGGETTSGCVTNLKIKVWVPKHDCNNAEFFMVLNNTVLYNDKGGYTANLNNSDTVRKVGGVELQPQQLNPGYGYISTKYGQDTKNGNKGGARVDEFVVTEEQSKSIVASGKGYIYVWMIGTTGKAAHDDIPQVEITKGTEIIFNGKVNAPSGLLMILDACGNKVLQVPKESQQQMPNMDSWVSKLVADRSKINIKEKLPRKVDTKADILDAVQSLIDKIETLEFSIFNTNEEKTDIANWDKSRKTGTTISQIYSELSQKINELNLQRKNPMSSKYVNDVLNGEMYGDVKRRLDSFYDTFNAMYYDPESKVYKPKGRAGSYVYRTLYT